MLTGHHGRSDAPLVGREPSSQGAERVGEGGARRDDCNHSLAAKLLS